MPGKTPLYSALIKEAEKKTIRMHMPGHKGKVPDYFASADTFQIDFTELAATGNLYEGLPPIADAEELMAQSAGAKECFFLTGGSTQGIMTAISVACPPGSTMITDRGSHRSVWSSMVHMDLTPEYLFSSKLEPWGIAAPLTASQIGEALSKTPDAAAVIITSPTFYGVLSDIEGIARVAGQYRVPLLVDEAHGAHLPFMEGYRGAVAQGAALAVVSAHKTLPALTSGACLFSGGKYDAREIRRKCAMFGTSSPSYPVMASMDAARAYLEGEGGKRYQRNAEYLEQMRRKINERGVFLALREREGLRLDPTRLTVCTAAGGIGGYKAAKILEEEYKIVCEMSDERNIVMIVTCADSIDDLEYLGKALHDLEKAAVKKGTVLQSEEFPRPLMRMKPREAAYAPREYMLLTDAVGRIAGEHLSPYPPGIPIVAAGEEIGREHLAYLEKKEYQIDREIAVIK